MFPWDPSTNHVAASAVGIRSSESENGEIYFFHPHGTPNESRIEHCWRAKWEMTGTNAVAVDVRPRNNNNQSRPEESNHCILSFFFFVLTTCLCIHLSFPSSPYKLERVGVAKSETYPSGAFAIILYRRAPSAVLNCDSYC